MKSFLRSVLVATLATSALSCGAHPEAVSVSVAEGSIDPGGIGSLQTRNERGETGKLRLEKASVKAKQAGDVAEVEVTHVFASDADVALEGTFRFPMPDGAIVTGLAMMVDGKMIEGELVENEKARKIYQEIVDTMQDPALLEWEHGSTFKMRVFPIEPKQSKTVTMRYLVPLRKKGDALIFAQGTRSVDDTGPVAALAVEWQGRPIFDERNVVRGRVIEAPAAPSAVALREERKDGVYSVVRLRPDWSLVPASTRAVPKAWVVVVDTSRSTLEERKLQLETMRTVLGGLATGSRFVMATSDLDTRMQSGGPRAVTPQSIDEAVRFVEATAPDGATDLGAMLHTVGASASRDMGVLYIGDCEPSWGETNVAKLREAAKLALPGVPVFPILLGASVDAEAAHELAGATGGRVVRAHTADDVAAFVASLRGTPRRTMEGELVQVPGTVMLPAGKITVDEGEEVVAFVRTAPGETPPKAVTFHAVASEKPIDTTVALQPAATPFVAQRFGAAWVHELEHAGKEKDAIVQASMTFSVMSKHTSFLVLDSEEAYERYAIERRNARNRDPRVTGVDALDSNGADISLDRIQPGDPEIVIDAPADAARVLVVLPDGAVKVAAYEPEAKAGRGAWMVRFLVDKGTPEGRYEARVYIEYANGTRETRTVHYDVDTTEPTLDVSVAPSRRRPGAYVLTVKQRAEMDAVDLRRVEARMPDGQLLALSPLRWGEHRVVWQPVPGRAKGTVHVVAFDRALNHTSLDVVVR